MRCTISTVAQCNFSDRPTQLFSFVKINHCATDSYGHSFIYYEIIYDASFSGFTVQTFGTVGRL